MTTKDTEGKADKTRSGPATGYATAVDAALAMSARTKDIMQHEKQYMRNDFECSMHTLAAEVRRLRAVLADINAIARLHPDESGREDFEALEVIADKSHNRVVTNTDG